MNTFLIIAGIASAIAAIVHLGCIYVGAAWYRALGAGENMALLSEQGSIKPTLITLTITLLLTLWSLYAFSAAGVIVKLPFIHLTMSLITTLYLVRGILGFICVYFPMGRSPQFWIWSSLISLAFGLVHLIGLTQQWALL